MKNSRIFFGVLSVFYALALYFFYVKYVPLIVPFQLALVPVLLLALVLTAAKPEQGTLFFVFAFPLINGLPYFFGIFEDVPHAPAALVLFLFYFGGWCLHLSFSRQKLSFNHPVFKPMALFSAFLLVSALLNFFRFSNFFPFFSDDIYELITNVDGVTAGGALMSTLFHSLNYVTGFFFFFLVLNTVRSVQYVRKIIFLLLLSTTFALVFGFYQQISQSSLGNTPSWMDTGQINSLFKTPNSFGAFLAAVLPLILGSIVVFRGWRKALPAALFISALVLFPHIGSRSALLGFLVSLVFFLILSIRALSFSRTNPLRFFKKAMLMRIILLITAVVIIAGVTGLSRSRLTARLKGNIRTLVQTGELAEVSPERYFLWKEAFHMIKDYPLTGVGAGAFIIELPNYYHLDRNSQAAVQVGWKRVDSAENYFLHVMAELGAGGLLLSAWLFWMVFRILGKSLRSEGNHDKEKFILAGISAGVVSLFTNYYFHSFVGSFETKYTFWLLVGTAAAWANIKGMPKEKGSFSRKGKILSVVLLAAFGGLYGWHCVHSLSLRSRTDLFDIDQAFGFYQLETTEDGRKFQWTGKYGGKMLEIQGPVIRIPLHASHPKIERRPVTVRIYLVKDFFKEKRLLDEISLRHSRWKTYEYSLPEEVGRKVILLIEVSRTWNPQKALGVPDPRNLGVAWGEISFFLTRKS